MNHTNIHDFKTYNNNNNKITYTKANTNNFILVQQAYHYKHNSYMYLSYEYWTLLLLFYSIPGHRNRSWNKECNVLFVLLHSFYISLGLCNLYACMYAFIWYDALFYRFWLIIHSIHLHHNPIYTWNNVQHSYTWRFWVLELTLTQHNVYLGMNFDSETYNRRQQ